MRLLAFGIVACLALSACNYSAINGSNQNPVEVVDSTEPIAPPETAYSDSTRDQYTTFVQKDGLYQFLYSTSWIDVTQEGEPSEGFYKGVALETSDYQMNEDGYPYLLSGATLFVSANITELTDVLDYLHQEPLYEMIAQDSHTVLVSSHEAIQYWWGYEGTLATQTVFIRDGVLYRIRFRYADEESKTRYWDDYLTILDSFQLFK